MAYNAEMECSSAAKRAGGGEGARGGQTTALPPLPDLLAN
jgi:hypothetical protein